MRLATSFSKPSFPSFAWETPHVNGSEAREEEDLCTGNCLFSQTSVLYDKNGERRSLFYSLFKIMFCEVATCKHLRAACKAGSAQLVKTSVGQSKNKLCQVVRGRSLSKSAAHNRKKEYNVLPTFIFQIYRARRSAAVVCDNINQALYLAGFSFFVSPQNIKLGTFFPRYAAPKNCPLIDLSARDKVALAEKII